MEREPAPSSIHQLRICNGICGGDHEAGVVIVAGQTVPGRCALKIKRLAERSSRRWGAVCELGPSNRRAPAKSAAEGGCCCGCAEHLCRLHQGLVVAIHTALRLAALCAVCTSGKPVWGWLPGDIMQLTWPTQRAPRRHSAECSTPRGPAGRAFARFAVASSDASPAPDVGE